MSPTHAIRPLQFTALASLAMMLGALACVRVHQTSGQEWALWVALLTLSSGCLCAGYLIGSATPAHAKVTAKTGAAR